MKISAQEEYGLRCLLQIARSEGKGLTSVSQIAEYEGLSVPYVEKLLRVLSRAGFVESVRGAKGGYRLAAPATETTLGEVLRALGNLPSADTVCGQYVGRREACIHRPSCSVRPVWTQIATYLNAVLGNVALSDLLDGERAVRQKVARVHSAAVSEDEPIVRVPVVKANSRSRSLSHE